jgi:hypothetical protein
MLKAVYALLGALIIAGYAYAGFTGAELMQRKKTFAPKGARGSQGGARGFWYGGYRGGK